MEVYFLIYKYIFGKNEKFRSIPAVKSKGGIEHPLIAFMFQHLNLRLTGSSMLHYSILLQIRYPQYFVGSICWRWRVRWFKSRVCCTT